LKESYIKKLVRILEDSSIDTIQISSLWGFSKIKLSKSSTEKNRPQENISSPIVEISKPETIKQPESTDLKEAVESEPISKEKPTDIKEPAKDKKIHHITAPLVGTFYSTPNPDEPPFIKKGDKIKAGQTICIIEAMKIFNEIESDVSGTIDEILVEDASPIEYGQNIISIVLDD